MHTDAVLTEIQKGLPAKETSPASLYMTMWQAEKINPLHREYSYYREKGGGAEGFIYIATKTESLPETAPPLPSQKLRGFEL